MKVSEIRKKIDRYYCGKVIIVVCLLLCTFLFVIGMLIESVFMPKWSGVLASIGYIGLVVFMIIGGIYPIGKYNIRKGLEKEDIISLLDFLKEYQGTDNKFYDTLHVIFRTTSEMIHDYEIMNWSTAKGNEDLQNKAWNYLFNYLKVSQIWSLNRENVKEFASELRSEIDGEKIDDEKLAKVEENKFNKATPKKRKNIRIRWNVLIVIGCLIALIVLVIFKCIQYCNSDLFSSAAFELMNLVGADIIAIFLAVVTLKAEWSSK